MSRHMSRKIRQTTFIDQAKPPWALPLRDWRTPGGYDQQSAAPHRVRHSYNTLGHDPMADQEPAPKAASADAAREEEGHD